jgi:apolipoprotein N-acyltransferase
MTTVRVGRIWSHSGWLSRMAVVAAGAIAAFGFAPFHFWGTTLVSLTLLFVRLVGVSGWDRPARAGFWTGLLFGLGWFSASCFWIASAFIERGPEFIPMIPPLVGGLAVVLSLFWGFAGAVVARQGSVRRKAILFVAAFMMAELARGHVLSGFPWNMAAYAFEPGGAISQSTSLFGVYGLTMVIYAVAALIGVAVMTYDWRPALGVFVTLAALFGFGTHRLHNATQDIHPGVVLRLVAVPFRQSEKINPATSLDIVNRYLAVSVDPGIETVTHLVWPEGAVNGLATEDEALLRYMGEQLSLRTPTPPVWLMNSLRQEVRPDRKGEPKTYYYNSAVAITFDALGNPAIAGSNDKKKLVPFGEFIPGGEWVERVGARLVSTAIASISPAPEKRISQFPGLPPISPQICYEVIFPGLTPRVSEGSPAPQAILNQSNDAWFGSTVGPAQHAAIARYRAIEEGLPLIRSAANGVSGVFDSYGRAERVLSGKRVGHLDTVLPISVGQTVEISVVNAVLALLNLCLILLGVTDLRRF